ncbi:MAG: DUF4384 domain-containing protein [Treponemataceae bacterium]
MKAKIIVLALVLQTVFLPAFGQSGLAPTLAPVLDSLAASHYEDQLQAAFGTFTFEYSELATPFSRWLEDELTRSVPSAKRVRLFNRSAAAAMDPAFRTMYADFFASNQVDALLSGKYFKEADGVRVRFDLTSLRNGNLIGSGEILLPSAELPRSVAIVPEAKVAAAAQSLSGLFTKAEGTSAARLDALSVSLSTERGPGGAYRDGENLKVIATVNQDAYLRLFHVDVQGNIKLIWPNPYGGGDGKVRSGTAVTIPGPSDPFDFKLGTPYGTEFIKAVASTAPFSSKESAFQDLGTDAGKVITRGLEISVKADAQVARRAEALASYVILEK